MRKKLVIPIIIGISLVFNIMFAIGFFSATRPMNWPFGNLGPAIMQDSYYVRAPGLESPFGIIGDIPGGYSLYLANPIQNALLENSSISSGVLAWNYGNPSLDTTSLVLVFVFACVPLILIAILGRRSYGSSKTQ